ncbi:MAG: hypothetical protein ABSA44_12980 [Bacteroidota bacterium]|jgi:hypothetical protein
MIINRFPVAIILSSVLTLHCSSTKPLSEAEKAKLDQPLLHLLTGKPIQENRLDILTRSDGTKEYAVIVQSEHPEAIRALGITVSSVFGDVIVVHVTLEELKNIVSLPTVRAVRTGSRRTIQQHH